MNSIVEAAVCSKSGLLPVEGLCDQDPEGNCVITEYFTEDTVPTEYCTTHVKVSICNESGASELIYALEEKQGLSGLVNDKDDSDKTEDDNHGIQVYIGNETPVESMKDCSVVTATYELQDGMKGTIGIIGPKRMDYEKVVDTLKEMQTHLDDVFKKT